MDTERRGDYILTYHCPVRALHYPVYKLCYSIHKHKESARMRFLLCLSLFGFVSIIAMEINKNTTRQPGIDVKGGEQCSTCEFREQSRLMRLHSIKSQIFSIPRLEQAPNISRDMIRQLLPKAPPLTQLLDQYDQRVEDDDHAATETIITMAKKCKYLWKSSLLCRKHASWASCGMRN